MRRLIDRIDKGIGRHFPPGVRSIAGVVLTVGGVFGFLPILGFWMMPIGLALIVLDLRAVRRVLKARGQQPKKPKDPD